MNTLKRIAIRSFYCATILLCANSSVTASTAINIDFGDNYGPPSAGFGAAAGTPGFWNNVTTGATHYLNDVNGNASGASVTVFTQTMGGFSGAPTSNFESLVNDNFFSSSSSALWLVRILGLASADQYDIYYYAPANGVVASGNININGTDVTSMTGGGSSLEQGTNWNVLADVDSINGRIDLQLNNYNGYGYAGLAGLQIVSATAVVPEINGAQLGIALTLLLSLVLLYREREGFQA